MKNILKIFKPFDIILWCCSIAAISISFAVAKNRDYLTLVSSITGVTALMFISKGHVAGQILTVIFSVFYGVVSYFFKYYGEMITYLGMSAPAAIAATVAWLRHPYKDKSRVEVSTVNAKKMIAVTVCAAAVTAAFYFILRALGTNNLVTSTVSVTTSFIAAALVFLRSPLYGLAYSVNDIVLIVLWTLAVADDIKYLPMVICFSLFLIYDVYGYINWTAMRRAQTTPPPENAEQNNETQ